MSYLLIKQQRLKDLSKWGITLLPRCFRNINMNGILFSIHYFRDAEDDTHNRVVDSFYSWINKLGIKAELKKETDIVAEDFKEMDLCITLGI